MRPRNNQRPEKTGWTNKLPRHYQMMRWGAKRYRWFQVLSFSWDTFFERPFLMMMMIEKKLFWRSNSSSKLHLRAVHLRCPRLLSSTVLRPRLVFGLLMLFFKNIHTILMKKRKNTQIQEAVFKRWKTVNGGGVRILDSFGHRWGEQTLFGHPIFPAQKNVTF